MDDIVLRAIGLAARVSSANAADPTAGFEILDTCAWCRERIPKGKETWAILARGDPPAMGQLVMHVPIGDRICHAVAAVRESRGHNKTFITCGSACLEALDRAIRSNVALRRRLKPVRVRVAEAWRGPERRAIADLSEAERQDIFRTLEATCAWCLKPANADPPVEVWVRLGEWPLAKVLTEPIWTSAEFGDRILHYRLDVEVDANERRTMVARFMVCTMDCGQALRAEVRAAAALSVEH